MLPLPGMGNALEGVTCTRYPEINKIKKEMLAAGAQYALMSGSGPTVFATGSTENYRSIAGMETGNSDCHNCEKECNINERTFKPYSA